MLEILIAIFNAYIIYNVLGRKGPVYTFYFLFGFDILYKIPTLLTNSYNWQYILIIIVLSALTSLLTVIVNKFVYDRTNDIYLFIVYSVMFNYIISVVSTLLILNLFFV